MKVSVYAAASVLVLLAHQAVAAPSFETGNSILRECSSNIPRDQAACAGYIMGASDEMQTIRDLNNLSVCPPVSTEASQIRDVFLNYLKAHPELRTQSASILLSIAIGDAWGCNK